MNNRKRSPIWKLHSNDFKKLIQNSKHYSQAMAFFGIQNHGGNFKTLKDRIAEEGIDDSHMKHYIKYEMPKIIHPGKPLKDLLIKNSPGTTNRRSIKKRLLSNGLLKNICYICDLPPEWEGKRLVLVLDHINGDNTDYRIENLRLLCPNCNSQTDTFCGRSIKRYYSCNKCGRPLKGAGKTGLCLKCTYRKPIPPKRKFEVSKEEMQELVWKHPLIKIAKKFKVSDVAIKKRCINLKIQIPPRGYWNNHN